MSDIENELLEYSKKLEELESTLERRVRKDRRLEDKGPPEGTEERRIQERREPEGPEIEFAGMSFKGGRIAILLTALSSLGGASWAGFEFYKDYMDMREIVQNIDVSAIEARNSVIETKLDEAIEYTRDIKSGLRDDILGIEKQADRIEDQQRELEQSIRQQIRDAEVRFENKRDSLQNDYDKKANDLRSSNDQRMTDLENKVERDLNTLESKLTTKLQKALDNPLAN